MGASRVQAKAISGSTSGATGKFAVAMDTPVTNGNTIVLYAEIDYSGLFTITATDNLGNTYTVKRHAEDAVNGFMVAELRAQNITGGACTIQVDIGFAIVRDICGIVVEVTGIPAAPDDASPVIATGSGTTATATATGVLAQADEIALCAIMASGGATTMSTPAGWTDSGVGQVSDGGGHRVQVFYKVTTATTSLVPASTLGTSRPWMVPIITLKAAATGSAAVTGTGGSGMTGNDIRAGAKTLILTLTGDTLNAFDDTIRAAIRTGILAATSPTWGFNNLKSLIIPLSGIVRTSASVCTITFTACPGYQSDTTETLTVTVPASALVLGVPVVATPTVAITRAATDLTPVDDYTMDGTATRTRP